MSVTQFSQLARIGATSLGLSALAVSVPVAFAAADDASTSPLSKAAIEHNEQQGEIQAPKRQIEQRELAELSNQKVSDVAPAGLSAADTSGWDAAAWQLALSALAGAAVTAGGIGVVYRFRHHAPSAVA